jgi:hypothetical protein
LLKINDERSKSEACYILYVENLQKETEKEQMKQKHGSFLRALVREKIYIYTLTETSKRDKI